MIDPQERFDPMTLPKKIYYRVYQDRENMDSYYVETWEGVQNSIEAWEETIEEGDLFPVIEPVYMSEFEFENLPEFQGF